MNQQERSIRHEEDESGVEHLPYSIEANAESVGTQCFQSFADAFLELNSKAFICGWNLEATRLFGWDPPDAVGHTLSELVIGPQDRERWERTLSDFSNPTRPRERDPRIELTAVDCKGRVFPAEISLFSIPAGAGVHIGLFVRDISFRKDLEQKDEKRLHQLINQFGEEYFETDLRGNYTFVNTRLTEYFGVQSGAELEGRSFKEFFGAEDVEMFIEAFRQVYLTGERVRHEYSVRLRGRLIHVEHTISLKRDGSGTPVGFIVLSRDCTERKVAQMELAKAKEAAEAANRAKSQFLAN